jgi:hypothetical protein
MSWLCWSVLFYLLPCGRSRFCSCVLHCFWDPRKRYDLAGAFKILPITFGNTAVLLVQFISSMTFGNTEVLLVQFILSMTFGNAVVLLVHLLYIWRSGIMSFCWSILSYYDPWERYGSARAFTVYMTFRHVVVLFVESDLLRLTTS